MSVASRNCAPMPLLGSHAPVTSSSSRLAWPLLNGAVPWKVTLSDPGLDGSVTVPGLGAACTVPASTPVAPSPRAVAMRRDRRRRSSCMNRSVAIKGQVETGQKRQSIPDLPVVRRKNFAELSPFPCVTERGWIEERTADAAAAAAELCDHGPLHTRHGDVIETGSPASRALRRASDQVVPYHNRLEKADVRACGDGALVVGVAGERERRVRKREQIAAVADAVPVGHVLADHHRRGR